MKHFYPLFVLFFCQQISAQQKSTTIAGKIESDSTELENVHIYNITANIGTISNAYGEFAILVRPNDTLTFSDIQLKTKTLIITEEIIAQRRLMIKMIVNINELNEIVLEKPKNMLLVETDYNREPVNAISLGIPNAGKPVLTQTERKQNYYKKGGSIDKIYGLLSGETKKINQLQEAQKEDGNLIKIREYLTDYFLMDKLDIPPSKIMPYLNYCKSKGIIHYFKFGNKMKVADIIIQTRDEYFNSLEVEKSE